MGLKHCTEENEKEKEEKRTCNIRSDDRLAQSRSTTMKKGRKKNKKENEEKNEKKT